MRNNAILTIQDISCFGQCSITVALPILSACGIETAIMPTTVLSTHTGGFKNFTFRDLTCDMPSIINHWYNENIRFKLLYTGYFGSKSQIDYANLAMEKVLLDNAKIVIDPVMADNGKLYYGFDTAFVSKMVQYIKKADILLPNITEAALLTNSLYKKEHDINYIKDLLNKLREKTSATIILKGINLMDEKIGIAISNEVEECNIVYCDRINTQSHGTGDCFAAAFIGAYLNNMDIDKSVKIAGDFIVDCLINTPKEHNYGVCFEKSLYYLMKKIK